jgi:hypothetical protein
MQWMPLDTPRRGIHRRRVAPDPLHPRAGEKNG